jgi:serine/threonine protein kinase
MSEVINEKNILAKMNHLYVVKLHASFLDKRNVYMVFDYAPNGDFSSYLKLNSKQATINQ